MFKRICYEWENAIKISFLVFPHPNWFERTFPFCSFVAYVKIRSENKGEKDNSSPSSTAEVFRRGYYNLTWIIQDTEYFNENIWVMDTIYKTY